MENENLTVEDALNRVKTAFEEFQKILHDEWTNPESASETAKQLKQKAEALYSQTVCLNYVANTNKPVPGRGKYALLRAGNPSLDEWVTVGVVLFNADGNAIGYRVNGDRARKIGFLSDSISEECLKDHCEQYQQINDVYDAHERMGHALSCIQIHWGGDARLDPERLEEIYQHSVLGT